MQPQHPDRAQKRNRHCVLSFRFRPKSAALVAYSLGFTAGARAVEYLTQIMVETEAVPVRRATLIPYIANAFDEESKSMNPAMNVNVTVMLDDLAWLGKALKAARSEGQQPPAALRIRAASGKMKARGLKRSSEAFQAMALVCRLIADSLSREVTGTVYALPCVLGMRPVAIRTVLA